MRKTLGLAPIVSIGVVASLSSVTSGQMIYNDEAAFLQDAGQVTTQTFENEPPVGDPDCCGQASVSVEGFTITADSYPSIKILEVEWYGNRNITPGGVRYVSVDTDRGGVSDNCTIDLDQPAKAFGLYLVDIEEGVTVTVNGAPYAVGPGDDGEALYFGIISDVEFTSIHLDGGGVDSHWSLDDVSYGAGGLTLEAAGDCPGTITLTAGGATPAARVYFVYSLRSGSTNVPGCPGVVVDLANPEIAGSSVADANGEAALTGDVPAAACGRVRAQAVELGACAVSNVVTL